MLRYGKIVSTVLPVLWLLMALPYEGHASGMPPQPNVIVILTDDQGYGDFSCHGNPVLKTPALDRLHDESIRFSDFHVAPLCTPTRGQLLSGLDGLRNKASTVGAGRNVIRRNVSIMPEVFAANGYQAGMFGKWHLGDNYPDRPFDRGFTKAVWFRGWGLLSESEFDNDYYRTRYMDGADTKQSEKYCTDLWFDESMKWMEEMASQRKPFFTYLATNTPHGPVYAPSEDFEYFSRQGIDEKTAHFFGMIRNIDRNMARLDRWLEEKKLKENTIVIYITDNGGTGGVEVFNAGMRGKKGTIYEGGHRAACFVRLPGSAFGAPRTIGQPAQVQDILPTLIDLIGLRSPRKMRFDGRSLKRLLKGAGRFMADRMFVVQYSDKNGPEKYFSSVVWNSWRLVGENELYDISRDPGQKQDISREHPDMLRKMRGYYERWWKELTPDLPNFVPHLIGSVHQNPVILTCDFWMDSAYVNTQWKVAAAGGPAEGGVWSVRAERGGKYKLALSRWPFHLGRALTSNGPDKTVGGTKIQKGVALPIAYGCVSLDDGAPVSVVRRGSADREIVIEMEIPAGRHRLRAWFRDEKGNDICGAYYLRVEAPGMTQDLSERPEALVSW